MTTRTAEQARQRIASELRRMQSAAAKAGGDDDARVWATAANTVAGASPRAGEDAAEYCARVRELVRAAVKPLAERPAKSEAIAIAGTVPGA